MSELLKVFIGGIEVGSLVMGIVSLFITIYFSKKIKR